MQKLELHPTTCSVKPIGSSNNSIIYKELPQQLSNPFLALKTTPHAEFQLHSRECANLKNEQQILKKLRHPNIIQVISSQVQENVEFNGKCVCGLEIELAEIDLFEQIKKTYPKIFKAEKLRELFFQICLGIQHCHDNEVAHNDIKLENIFLFEKGTVAKIADFGFARQGEVNEQMDPFEQCDRWEHRTLTMLAPEILEMLENRLFPDEYQFDEKKSDIFALGIILFQLVYLRLPFESNCAQSNDEIFKHFYTGEIEKFWEQPEISRISKIISNFSGFRFKEFQDLINKMLQIDPKQRITIDEIIEHPWICQEEL